MGLLFNYGLSFLPTFCPDGTAVLEHNIGRERIDPVFQSSREHNKGSFQVFSVFSISNTD